MYLIGLTGGIASGKSLAARRLADHGAIHVDADAIAREVVAPGTPGLARIAEEFGASVIAADGLLDRPALGTIVFRDPERLAALNNITHPAVRARVQEIIDETRVIDADAVIVYDVPLLVEADVERRMSFDLVVVVHADRQTRIQRLIELRGMSCEEAAHRLNSQASDTERLAIADVVIDNNGTLDEFTAKVDELWASLPERTARRDVGSSA